MRVNVRATAGAAGLVGTATAAYLGLVTGRLTLDLGVGRRSRPLGPLTVDIAAPPDVVYAVAAAPYAVRRPRALREKVDVWDRTETMVLAAHRTSVGRGMTTVTVEVVTFDPPRRIGFRLLRGPVPHVAETFQLEPTATGTRLVYTGEMGTDLWRLGERWGDVVARTWVGVVQASLDTIRAEAERRA
jgi:Polyketide cyclase / dehydrase and lipid transport